jgi:hypothetical protein
MTIEDFRNKHADDKYAGTTNAHLLPGLFRDAVCLIAERLEQMNAADEKRHDALGRLAVDMNRSIELLLNRGKPPTSTPPAQVG